MRLLPNHSSRVIGPPPNWPVPYEITVTPPQIEFGSILRYGYSVVTQATVTNTGKYPVEIGEITVTGDFNLSHEAPKVLLPGKHFLLNITFAPKRVGVQSGSVYVNTGDAAGTEFVRLVGRGYTTADGGGGQPSDGDGVDPLFWSGKGDGETTDFPLPDADVFNKLFYDTAMEATVGARDYLVVKPNDFSILPSQGSSPPMIRFVLPPLENQEWFTTCRGYAKPWRGDDPIDTVAPGVDTTIIIDNTVINRANQNTLIVVNSSDPITIRIRKKTGDDTLDWKLGEFFSVMQRGDGPVTIAIEGNAGTLFPPLNFLSRTRGKNCVISATCINPDADQWVLSGDLLRGSDSQAIQTITMADRSVLIGSAMTVGANKDNYRLLTGLKLDPVADNGLVASLMTAQTGGTIFTVDILRNGVSILASKLVINNGTKTSQGAVTPATYVTNGDTLLAGDEITLAITQVGDGTARGLRVYLTGQQS